MIRLAVSVEGQTEEEFVNSLLADHLQSRQVAPTPILLGRGRRPGVGGGNVSAPRLASEMAHLCHSFDVVTSLVDFYGFRDKGGRRSRSWRHILAAKFEQESGGVGIRRRCSPMFRSTSSRVCCSRTWPRSRRLRVCMRRASIGSSTSARDSTHRKRSTTVPRRHRASVSLAYCRATGRAFTAPAWRSGWVSVRFAGSARASISGCDAWNRSGTSELVDLQRINLMLRVCQVVIRAKRPRDLPEMPSRHSVCRCVA